MSDRSRKAAIIMLVVAGCTIMAFVEAIIRPDYAVKSVIKLISFLVLPAGYSFFDKETRILNIFRFRRKGLLHAAAAGILVYGIIIGGYFLLRPFFDLTGITAALSGNIGVNRNNFVFVAVYISFINSLLEEFFFRGFAFLTLKKRIGSKASYLFSAGMFSLYHITMMISWFSIGLFVLLFACLFAAGLFFDWLDEKGNIYPSWAVHMFANFATNTIGFILFGII